MTENVVKEKIVNLQSDRPYTVLDTKVNGFVNKIKLPVEDIKNLLLSGVTVIEIVDGKPIMLSLTTYNLDLQPKKEVKVGNGTTTNNHKNNVEKKK